MHIAVLGGGFGGVATARHLERALRGHTDVEITLVSRDNFLSSRRSCSNPARGASSVS
jgi:NADH dehydrogenase FAD-containing subunit